MKKIIIYKTKIKTTLPAESTEENIGDLLAIDMMMKTPVLIAKKHFEKFGKDKYTPIGILVIPADHNVYGTGQGAIVSIHAMSCKHPDTGSTEHESIYWGNYGYTTGQTYLKYEVILNSNIINPSLYSYVEEWTKLPSDRFKNNDFYWSDKEGFTKQWSELCQHDQNAGYWQGSGPYVNPGDDYPMSNYLVPSPYLTNGSRNPLYYASPTYNSLSDFKGYENTQKLISLATGQSNWKTAATLTNSYGANYFPAACACWRYHCEGTKQGEWYLPAEGELGYFMARYSSINESIKYISEKYNITIPEIDENNMYWSSTEYNSQRAKGIYTFDGSCSFDWKDRTNSLCRAFRKI